MAKKAAPTNGVQEAAEHAKQQILAPRKPSDNVPKWELGLSTGSTVLNLACSGRPDIGFAPGNFYVWCGRSGSGKSFITLTTLAEASINPKYKDHNLVYDPIESGALMDFGRFFGQEMARRVVPPAGTKEKPKPSRTLEELYHNIFSAMDSGPCVYLVDSMDPLPTNDELRDFLKKNRARSKGDTKIAAEEAGSYGTQRAKVNSTNLRIVFNKLQGSPSMLIVIFQSRQAIGPGSTFNPDTRGGGLAPTFYAGLELWSQVSSKLKTSYKGKNIEQGVVCKVRVKKNRLQGKDRTALVPIYHSGPGAGIDDVGGCVDYLVEWKRWTKTGEDYDPTAGKITAPEFKLEAKRETLVKHILDNNWEGQLRELVLDTWREVEEAAEIYRKPRYQ